MPTGTDATKGLTEQYTDSTLLSSVCQLASRSDVDQLAVVLRALVTEPLELVRTLASVGSVDRVVELVETALTLGLPADLTARLRCLLVELHMSAGKIGPALATAEEILGEEARGDDTVPPSVRGAVAASRTFGRYFLDAEEGRHHAETVLRAYGGEVTRNAETLAAAAVLSDALLADGDLTEGLRLARTAADAARTMPSPVWRLYLHLVLADRLVDAGAHEEAESVMRTARADIGGLSGGVELAFAHLRARLLSRQGRLAEARDEAQQALAAAVGRGARLYVPPLLASLGQLALRFGDLDGAVVFVRRCREALGDGRFPSTVYDWVELQVTEARYGPRAALDHMNRHYADRKRRTTLFMRQPGAAAWFVRTALAGGDPHWAAVAARDAARLAERNPDIRALSTAALHAGSLLAGDPDGLVRAATEDGHHWARMSAAEDLTALLDARSRDRTSAIGRGPVPPAPPEGADRTTSAALSDVERTVARLVGEGLTNQQVAFRLRRSPHTVNYHLRNIFRKLGLSSRVELARHAHLWMPAPR
ncbi:helix-turn-helix transcriptional regulator [Streptomyces prunicolor]